MSLQFLLTDFNYVFRCGGVALHGGLKVAKNHFQSVYYPTRLRRRDAPLWARIAQNVKKPPLTVNVINFEFFGFNVSISYGTVVRDFESEAKTR